MNRAQRRQQVRRAHQNLSNGAPVLRSKRYDAVRDESAILGRLTACGCDRRAYLEAGAVFVEVLHERGCPVLAGIKRGKGAS